MRSRAIAFFMVALCAHSTALAEAPPQRRASSSDRSDSYKNSADVDLGAATLAAGQGMVGPWLSAYGIADRLTVGTFVLPWFATVVAPGSYAANVVVKVRLFEIGRVTVATQIQPFYAYFEDADRADLKLRAFVVPALLLLGAQWTSALATTLEVAGVFSTLTGSRLGSGDNEVLGVAVANSLHLGLLPRYRFLPWLTGFARVRVLLGQTPVVGRASTTLRDGTTVDIDAQTSGRALSSGMAMLVGAHVSEGRFTVSGGVGYGTWFIPGVLLPLGHNTPIAELNAHVRF